MSPKNAAVAITIAVVASTTIALADWTQFGGPRQDFKVKTEGLAPEWPEGGPARLWERKLGEGYSGIVVADGRVFTMYRDGEQEVVAALNAKNGKTVWEHRYDAPVHPKHEKTFNAGPRSTPLVFGDRLYAIGCSGKLHCLGAKTGKVHWKQDLWEDFGGTFLNHGYSSSAFPYKDTVIVTVGGEGHAIVAFDKKTGDRKWQRLDFGNSYSTPKLVEVDGREQLLCFMAQELVAVDPANGELLWSYEIGNQWNQNICQPVLGTDNILFLSVAQVGSRGLRLSPDGKKTRVEEIWSNDKVKIHHSNAIRIGDHIYTSSGGMGSPGLLYAIDAKTGEIAWKQRGFAKATCLYADGRFILLDEDGNLGLATATPDFLEIHGKAKILEPRGPSRTWTVPTLDGTTLYLRDSSRIVALDLGLSSKET